MRVSAVNREYLGQNTLRSHAAEYAAGRVANQTDLPLAVKVSRCDIHTPAGGHVSLAPDAESLAGELGEKPEPAAAIDGDLS
jgi:hypothetical protein